MTDLKIIVDTSSDIPKELLSEYNIGMINFLTVFGDESYVAGVEITNEEFYKRLSQGNIMPTTAQTPYLDMYDYLLKESLEHKTVVYFTISSKGSGQNHTAQMIADEIKEKDNPNADIRIVDTMSYSVYIAATAVYAAKLAKEDVEVDEILKKCDEYIKSWDVYLLVDSLKYLERGGRIKKTAAVVGTLLDIKPVLSLRDGLIEAVDKLRGKKKVMKKLVELVKNNPGFDAERKEFMIVHSDAEAGNALAETLKEEFGDITITMFSEFGPIVGTHTGPGCYAVLFRKKQK